MYSEPGKVVWLTQKVEKKVNKFISGMADISLAFVASAAISGALAGCGASGEDISDDVDIIDAGEIGEAGQAFSAPTSPSFQLGSQTGGSRQRCNRTSSGQVCQIPPRKDMTWCGSGDGAYINDMVGVVNGFDDVPGWSFPLAATLFSPCSAVFRNIEVISQSDGCGANGTASNDVKDYVCNTFSQTTGLSEAAGVVGSYQTSVLCQVKVDFTQLLAKGTTDAIDHFYYKHAVAHGVAACLGIGGRAGFASTYASRQALAGVAVAVLSPGEVCTLQAFSAPSNGPMKA
mgnify:CR=1 FL=1